ncbi:MAG: hypothetical protein P8P30_11115 [Rickettsiales bacterium]|nr:hypothetical protein [Rickettsiales bacterium]
MTDQTQPKNRPENIRDGMLNADIWRNEGEKGAYYSTQFSRAYKDKEGNYRRTDSFSKDDLLRVSELARNAYNRVSELQQHDRQQNPQHDPQAREAFRDKRQAQANGQDRAAPSRDY